MEMNRYEKDAEKKAEECKAFLEDLRCYVPVKVNSDMLWRLNETGRMPEVR